MASKKVNCGTSSFLKSSNGKETEDEEPKNVQNTFLNDGSFFEQYKKRMEDMAKAQSSNKDIVSSGANINTTETVSKTSTEETASAVAKTSVIAQGKKRLMVGRMGGASKQFNAKKKKLEKQAATEKDGETNKGNNTAWNAYMEEVKKYREASCTEEVDRIRPLVK